MNFKYLTNEYDEFVIINSYIGILHTIKDENVGVDLQIKRERERERSMLCRIDGLSRGNG